MNKLGWVKLHRKVIDSRVFANEGLLKLWVYCLCRANHEKNFVPISTGGGGSEVEVFPGQFIFGRKSVSRELRMNPNTLYGRMKKLEDMGNINMDSNTHYTTVSICNWGAYQNKEDEDQQEDQQPSNTDRNNTTAGESGDSDSLEVAKDEYGGKYEIGDSGRWDEEQPVDYKGFVDLFNEIYESNLRTTGKKRENIRARLRTFTGKEIKTAWENRLQNKWLNNDGKKYMADWKAAMRNDEKIDNYLNQDHNETIQSNGIDLNKAANDLTGVV